MKLQFADFVIDSDSRLLTRGGEPVHLSRKAFDALLLLLDRRPNAVGKEELHDRLWPGTFVVDANLSVTMAEVRRALGDDPQESQFIRTVHRVGYAFAAEAHDGVDDETWLFHLRARDYSRWLRESIGDEELAGEVAEIEDNAQDAKASRQQIRAAIERRYTAAAKG